MNRDLVFGAIIITILLGVFLFKKYKSYPEYLVVVPNDRVKTPVRQKRLYTMRYSGLTFGTFSVPAGVNVSTLTNYTGTTLPAMSTNNPTSTNYGIPGISKTLSIYNATADAFNIIGVSLSTVAISGTTPVNKIGMTMGVKGVGTPTPYNGDKIALPGENQIQFTNLAEYILQRLTIICNNVTNRSLYIYFTNASGQSGGIRINNLTNEILIIDLYNTV